MSTRKTLLILLSVVAGGIALGISTVVFIVFVVSGVILAIVRRLPKQAGWARATWYLIIIAGIAAAAIFVPFVRSHPPVSCENSIRGFVGRTSDKPRTALERVPADAQLDFQRAVDTEGLELLQHAAAAKKSGAVLNSARATLSLLAGALSGDAAAKLSSGIESLQRSVDNLNRDGLEARTERLKTFVADKREQAKKVRDQQEFLDEFERLKTDEKWSFEDIYSKMVGLQDLLARFVNSKVKDGIAAPTFRLTAHLDEQAKTVVYEERVGIALGRNVVLRQVDFSELQLNGQFTGMRQTILYSYDNAQSVVADSASISVPEGVRRLTVLNQVLTSANFEDACNAPRLLPFRRFFVKWPDASPTSIGLLLNIANLTNRAGSVPFYFPLLVDKKLNIDEIEIPEYSFFNSHYGMKEDAKGMPGGISPPVRHRMAVGEAQMYEPIHAALLVKS